MLSFFFGLRSLPPGLPAPATLPSHSLGCDLGKNLSLIAASSFAVFIRGLPTLVSLAGAVDAGGIFGGDSDNCCRPGGGLADVRGLPGVLFTSV